MKNFTFLLIALFFTSVSYSQVDGSGTITFNSASNVPIEATATSLFDDGAHVYQISGNTNEAIPFGDWYLSETLGENNELFLNDIYIPKNPNGSLNVFIKANNTDEVSAYVYNINGKLISSPQPYKSDNGVVHIYDSMLNASDGLYFVNVSVGSKKHSLKYIKIGDETGPITLSPTTSNKMIESKNFNRSVMANNYIISWNNNGNGFYSGSHSVEVLEGNSNAIVTSTTPVVGTEHGDFGVLSQLNSNPQDNIAITVTNTITADSTYTVVLPISSTVAAFADAYVSDANNPTSYQVDVVSNLDDPNFLPTTEFFDIYQDVNGEINGLKTIELTPLPTTVDLTVNVKNPYTELPEVGATLELLEYIDVTTIILIDTQVTNAEGYVDFSDVDAGEYRVRIDQAGDYYKVTYKKRPIIEPETISMLTDTLNFFTSPKVPYPDTSFLTADRVNESLLGYRIPSVWLEGKAVVYFPPSPNRDFYINRTNQLTDDLGGPRITIVDELVTSCNSVDTSDYFPGMDVTWGSNMEWVGTETNYISTPYDGKSYIICADPFKVGGTPGNSDAFDHEFMTWYFGFGPSAGYPTCTSISAAANIEYFDSIDDQASMPYTIMFAKALLEKKISSMPRFLEE